MNEENAKQDNVLEFLKGYSTHLRSGFPWETLAPCNPVTDMPRGITKVMSCNGDMIAYFHTVLQKEEYDPSTPVSPRDVACAKLLADTINFLAKKEKT